MSLAEFDEIKFEHSTTRLDRPSSYLKRKARRNPNGIEEGIAELRKSMLSNTVYVGNLSFYSSEEQIYELFNKCGDINRIIMGLDRFKFTPCGFCFVIYNNAKSALNAVKYLDGTKLDNRKLQIDMDPGFSDGRQFGRGKNGGQVSDEFRFEFDANRGGYSFNDSVVEGGSILNNGFGARRIRDVYIPNIGEGGDVEEDSYVPGQ
ncbi:probable Nuclear cap-binding protein subunit 2 [Saccharomycodes ludwigii]|uniref:Nuclear cap-binding protein subunit 2 n=1 Tax=Saccharomycodes ludwigii TaxID=36035 RepID=A0A376B648_9ASCO|nr:hypothetical protein SCDLUD_001050 [Saccharomycodes ludwigii]KAH3903414.1 hypothetical protein SCDLUD_001050 [Saccharomycodes ludwigii]SSD60112.1 probable Nuclear cap-binding protein subunit 2 [Saccharomycodes ludwigii]